MSRLFQSKYATWITLAINTGAMYLYSAAIYLLMMWIYTGSSLDSLKWAFQYPVRYLCEATIIFLVGMTIYTACRRASVAMLSTGFIFLFYASVNYFKVYFREEPLFPWDFYNVSMAVSTLPMISLRFPPEIILGAIFLIVTFVVVRLIEKKWIHLADIRIWFRIGLPILIAVITVFFVRYIAFNENFLTRQNIWINRFIQVDNYRDNGMISAFIRNFKFVSAEKPAGYSQQAINSITEKARETAGATQTPNIIILMNESFTDPARYKNVEYTEDITPFFHNLQKNYTSGYVLGCQFGGGTANSEFEVLTGYGVAMMPPGGVPYQQYFNVKQPSYASYLKSKGYNTLAIHSYEKHFWNRYEAYPNMGFDRFIAQDAFPDEAERKRGFITDMEVSKMIISEYEQNKSTGKPLFIHAVTVQNHVEYKPDQYSEEEQVKLTSNPFYAEQAGGFVTYLTGLKFADQSLEYLVNYFENTGDPTIIIFFGDHLAKIGEYGEADFITAGYLTGDGSAQDAFDFYSTPYVIWDNFSNKGAQALKPISMYQLLPTVTTMYNLPRSAYFNYLYDQQSVLRGYAQSIYLGGDGIPTFEPSEEMKQKQKEFEMLEYDNFFGKRYGNDKLTR